MATRTIADGGGNWSAAGTWVEGVAPTNADDVVATATSGQVTVDTTTCVAKSVDLANYTNTLTFTAAKILTVSGSVNFTGGVGCALAGTGNLTINAAATLTSNALTFPGSLTFNINGTVTLGDNWTVTGLVSVAVSTLTLNGNQLTCNAGLTMTGATASGSTTNIVIGGTGGIWSGGGNLRNNLTFNCTTATISGSVTYSVGTITYTAGTITTTSSTLTVNAATTLNTNGITWSNIALNASVTYTLTSALVCTGTLSFTAATPVFAGAGNISCGTLTFSTSTSLSLVAGKTLTISTAINASLASFATSTIKSATASSYTNLVYQGTAANCKVAGITFTDVDASGSVIPIDNWYGGTLTRVLNIANKTSANLARSTDASKILTGQTVGLIAGSAPTGGSGGFMIQ